MSSLVAYLKCTHSHDDLLLKMVTAIFSATSLSLSLELLRSFVVVVVVVVVEMCNTCAEKFWSKIF